MLTVDNVSKKLSGKTILHDINLEFDHGVYGLLAPNGAGKTTLMKLMTTLLFPDTGAIRLDGEDITALGERYRGQVGYLPQDFGYYPNYTPRQFLRYIAALQGMPRAGLDERINTLLDMVGLADSANKRMRTFSGGMIQRVGIAQALVHDPRILILDEPTAGLDPKERVRFRNIIHSFAANRIVILSTHIVSDLETIAGHIVMLRDGTVFANAAPADICKSMEGKIYEVPADMPLHFGQRLLSEVQYGGVTRLRIYSPEPIAGASSLPAPGIVPTGPVAVAPNLEDAFLVIYGG
ncbi:ABC transporter ATP-binding protein [Bifidobacterium miconisargentati]|uniref:ABC transporter ATP-binding protein n=1 Tax=Bifidobacterium miconisargentati TaxID=2834437 RepID=UPI001BDD195C|nr:ABC transporter ATP-binding protein [Bifidobacterium miconisargentati]MBW3090523.1 ABC transporter ATP-binding protein [Bifidobacterium miconisargentati]